MSRAPAKSIF
jgi:serum/glucocorticoid-regulated kinase 2